MVTHITTKLVVELKCAPRFTQLHTYIKINSFQANLLKVNKTGNDPDNEKGNQANQEETKTAAR